MNTTSQRTSGDIAERTTRVKIIGVGGAGCNAVDRIHLANTAEVSLAAVNTDAQALAASPVQEKIMIGRSITRGLSCGGDAAKGRRSAAQDEAALRQLTGGYDLVFLLAGLGGGTGSGAAPEIARIASEQGALVIAFVTRPFSLEGEKRLTQADEAIVALREHCGAVVPLPNDLLLQHLDESATVLDAFEQADNWICRGVGSICTMLFRTGLINLDFAALRETFNVKAGKTLFGLGRGEGEDAVQEALTDLELCPLIHTPDFAKKADRLLVNVVGGPDLSMKRVNEIMKRVTDQFSRGQHIALGAVIDETWVGRLEICVLGTTDMTGGAYMQRVQKGRPIPQTAAVASNQAPVAESVHRSKLDGKQKGKSDVPQEEFYFIADDKQRGFFENSDRNLFEGQDLDVPTFLRQGIRIAI